MKIKDLVFELVNKGKYEFYQAEGIIQRFTIEENKNVNPIRWNSGFKSFASLGEAVKYANIINFSHFEKEIEKCKQMITDWEVK